MPREEAGTPEAESRRNHREDVRAKFRAAVTGSPDRYRVYAYRVKPPPKFDPHTPSYVARWDWIQVEDDLEGAVSALGPGLYRLDFRDGSERVTSDMMQIDPSAVAALDHGDNGDSAIVAELRALRDSITRQERAPAAGIDLEGIIQLAQALNPGSAATEAALHSALDAFQLGMQVRGDMEPPDTQNELMQIIASAVLPQLMGNRPAARETAGTAAGRRQLQRRSPHAGAPPAGTPRRRRPQYQRPAAREPEEQEDAAPVVTDTDSAGSDSAQSESPAASSENQAASDFEQFVWQVEGAIASEDDPDWWAEYVMKMHPEFAPALNQQTWQTLLQRVKDHPEFPGMNSPEAQVWIRQFLERVDTLKLMESEPESEATGASATT